MTALASLLLSALLALPLHGQLPVPAQFGQKQPDSTGADSVGVGGAAATVARADSGRTSSDSPRAALRRFLALTRGAQYDSAAVYLELPTGLEGEGARLARELRAVLDRRIPIVLDRVSGAALGDTTDGLAPGVDELGTITGDDGESVPVQLARTESPADAARDVRGAVHWRFAESTVERIPGWYDELEGRWALEHLPAPLLRVGPLGVRWWQWLALPLLVAVASLVGSLVGRAARAVLTRVVSRTRNAWDDAIIARLQGPLSVAATLLAVAALLPFLSLSLEPAEQAYRLVRGALFVDFFWALWRLVDVVRNVLASTRWATATASSRSLLPLGARVAKVAVGAIAAVAILSLLGYPVASLIAGLGLGGLALALAAQKTVENLFGAFSLGVDQPFREHDFVKIEEFVGTVEAIGLRSTRFRTLDRTLIAIPNGRLAEMRIESYTARDRLRLATVIGLVYETTSAQMREVLEGFERTLRAHPKIWPDTVVVRFREFAASSLDIEVMAWFTTADWGEFQLIRQEVLLEFMSIVEQAGTSFAFPTQTLHLASVPSEVGARALAPSQR